MSPKTTGTPGTSSAKSTPTPAQGNPAIQTGVQDHSFHTQAVFEINKQVAKLEIGLDGVEKRLEKIEKALGKIESDLTALNSRIDFVKPIAKSIGKGIWALVLILVTFGLTMLGYWTKHHFGW